MSRTNTLARDGVCLASLVAMGLLLFVLSGVSAWTLAIVAVLTLIQVRDVVARHRGGARPRVTLAWVPVPVLRIRSRRN